jgi:O-antigen/teichoic acid export membrane protein
MQEKLRRVRQSDFLKNNAVFFFGTLMIAVFNYLYYPVISRLVSISDFGEIQSTISIFMQLGIVLTAFGYVVINIINNTSKKSEEYALISALERRMLIISLVLFALLMILSVLFQDSFKFQSIVPLMLVGLLIIINIPSTSRTYILQGERRFLDISIAGVIFAAGKLVLTVGFIFILTNDVTASILGYIIAQLANLWYVSGKVGHEYPLHAIAKRSLVDGRRLSREMSYGFVVFMALSGLSLLYITDTIVARLFFDPETLGLYSGVSSVARIIFFVTASVAGVLIASVKMSQNRQENLRVLSRSLALVGLIGGGMMVCFMVVPSFWVNMLVGGAYTTFSHWLPLLSIMMFLASINNVLVSYLLAMRRRGVLVAIGMGVVALSVGLTLSGAHIKGLISSYVVANIIMAVILLVQVYVKKGSVK